MGAMKQEFMKLQEQGAEADVDYQFASAYLVGELAIIIQDLLLLGFPKEDLVKVVASTYNKAVSDE